MSTGEVGKILNEILGVTEVNVYGVSITNMDGKAGMASLVLPSSNFPPNFDFLNLSSLLRLRLPSYARPIFLRFRMAEHDKTSTLKLIKVKYVRQGYQYLKIEEEGDQVWFWPDYKKDDPCQVGNNENEWIRVNESIFQEIESGQFKL